MATTVHEPPKIRERDRQRSGGPSGNGGGRNPVPGNLRAIQERPSAAASTGIWVGVAAISMTFAALTSALVVRKGGSTDWRHFTIPPILYFNTLVLLASSVTLEAARRRVAAVTGGLRSQPARWLYLTLALGLVFVAGQYIAWVQLSGQGLYLATNPASSFFYVLTAAHALHVVGGLGGLVLVISRLRRLVLRRSTMDIASRYWHFMDVLWIYLLFLLYVKL